MTAKPPRILLDMDGVFTDFITAACALHGFDAGKLYALPGSKGVWETETLMGITPAQFWSPIVARGHDFWAGLDWTRDGRELFDLAFGVNDGARTFVLTSPSDDPGSYAGKYSWMRYHAPYQRRRLIPTEFKHEFADDRSILIDDRAKNVEDFRLAGGRAILVPRQWNPLYGVKDAVGYVEKALAEELSSIV